MGTALLALAFCITGKHFFNDVCRVWSSWSSRYATTTCWSRRTVEAHKGSSTTVGCPRGAWGEISQDASDVGADVLIALRHDPVVEQQISHAELCHNFFAQFGRVFQRFSQSSLRY
jgi:hypothetical protein